MSNEQAYIDATGELKRQRDEALAEERKAFVREAAMRMFALVDQSASERHGFACLMMKADEAWSLATQLWEARPDDC